MGYQGAHLPTWFSNTEAIEECCEEIADAVGDFMQRTTVQNTPIDTGWLRQEIRKKITVVTRNERGEKVYETGSETSVEYAPYVEHGTGLWGPRHARYVIKPRNPDGWLRWINPETGEPVFAKRVMHPGSPGAHMFAIGVAMAEHSFEALAEGPIRKCMVKLERSIHRHRVVNRRRI